MSAQTFNRWTLTRLLRRLMHLLRGDSPLPLPPLRYFLEVYEPGSRRECAASFDASTPVVAIAVGDILNPGIWTTCEAPRTLLRVVKVEHIRWAFPGGRPSQKVCIWTEAVAS